MQVVYTRARFYEQPVVGCHTDEKPMNNEQEQ